MRGEAEIVAIWEPLATRLKNMGYREICSCKDIGVNHCCTLAANSSLDQDLLRKISILYHEAIRDYRRDPYKWLGWYSAKIGISVNALKHDIRFYEYKDHLEVEESIKLIKNTGVKIPDPIILRDIVLS